MNNRGQRIRLEQIPTRNFVPVVKVQDVIKVKTLSKEERQGMKSGAPDIKAEPFVGNSGLIFRKDLVDMFTYTSGKKIHMRGWKVGQTYIVCRRDNSQALAMKVPSTIVIDVNNKQAVGQQGVYIVCLPNQDGAPDYSTASIISSKLFHKMFIMSNTPEARNTIQRHRDIRINRVYNQDNQGQRISPNRNPQRSIQNTINTPVHTSDRQQRPQVNISTPKPEYRTNNNPVVQNNTNNTVKYKLIGQIHNDCGQRVGFTLVSSNGRQADFDIKTVMKMCQQKLVVNAKLVNRNGSIFLSGLSGSLDNLPIKYI